MLSYHELRCLVRQLERLAEYVRQDTWVGRETAEYARELAVLIGDELRTSGMKDAFRRDRW